MPNKQFTYQVVASPLHDEAATDSMVQPLRQMLDAAGGEPSGLQRQPSPERAHCYLVATGGTEATLLAAIAERRAAAPFEPVMLIAHPDHNSLPAALETVARLHQDQVRARVIVVRGPIDIDLVTTAISDLQAVHRFRKCRIGLIGEPSEWLIASTPQADTVRRVWGPQLVDVKINEVLDLAHETPVSLGRAVAARFESSPDAPNLPAPHDLESAAHLHPVLGAIASRHELDAMTVRCFDFLGELNTSGCVALAAFNDTGFVAGCEGDVPASLAMLWARYLLEEPSWIANPAYVDAERNRVELAHCTIAPSMVESVELSDHFESGLGVGIHGRFAPGPVTLIRIGGDELNEVWLAEGQIVSSDNSVERCRTQATVELTTGRASDILDHPLGNHLVLVLGHHADRLQNWWRMAIGAAQRISV